MTGLSCSPTRRTPRTLGLERLPGAREQRVVRAGALGQRPAPAGQRLGPERRQDRRRAAVAPRPPDEDREPVGRRPGGSACLPTSRCQRAKSPRCVRPMLPAPSPPIGTPPTGRRRSSASRRAAGRRRGRAAPIGRLPGRRAGIVRPAAPRLGGHFSTPVTTTPRMNARWARKNTTTGTAIVISAAAWMSVGCGRRTARCTAGCRPTAAGAPACSPRYSSGRKKSFQAKKKWNRRDRDDRRDRLRHDHRAQDPERARAVDHRGLVQVARDRHEVLAQQEDVVGVGEEVRDDQRQPGPVPAELGEDRRTVGMSVTWNGRMIVAIRMMNSMFLPGNRNRAKP